MDSLEFECPVCYSIDYEQKIIPECGHSFCTKCLDKVTNENQLLCPECRAYCRNTDKLVKNYSINRQIEMRRQNIERFQPQTEQDHILHKQVQTLKSQLMLQQLQIQNLQQVNVCGYLFSVKEKSYVWTYSGFFGETLGPRIDQDVTKT